MTEAELQEKAIECFDQAETVDKLVSTIYLPKARFYLDEIERRKNDRISLRDFRMELIIIALIFAEIIVSIGLAIRGERQQAKDVDRQLAAFGKVQDILSHLQESSKATADTLTALKGTTDTMNGAIQKQVELFYEVDLNVVYQETSKQLWLINNGRTNIMIWGSKAGSTVLIADKPWLISPSGGVYQLAFEEAHKSVSAELARGTTKTIPYSLFVENEKHNRFTIHVDLIAAWHGDTMIFKTQTKAITPGWDKK